MYHHTEEENVFSFEPAWGHHPAIYSPISTPIPDDHEFYRIIACLRILGYTVITPKPSHPELSPREVQVWWLDSNGSVQDDELSVTDPDLHPAQDGEWSVPDSDDHLFHILISPRATDDSILQHWLHPMEDGSQ